MVKTYSQLEKDRPDLAPRVLALYKDPRNKNKKNVVMCGLYLQGKCESFYVHSQHVRSHIARHHSNEKSVQLVKIISYPGCDGVKTPVQTELMPFSQLKEKNAPLAKRVLKSYYGQKRYLDHGKIHICFLCLDNKCDYISFSPADVLKHMKRKHPKQTSAQVYKIINYPSSHG